MSASIPAPGGRIAHLLELDFGGHFMARLATDPDPTNEERGISGYTMALVSEPPLDQTLRLQLDPGSGPQVRCHGPAKVAVGVNVQEVRYDGCPYSDGERLFKDARLALEGSNPPFPGPTFESRNNIVGSDDTMMFIINPFNLAVYPAGGGVLHPGHELLRACDYLDPADRECPVWDIEDPATYARRLPSAFEMKSAEVLNVTGVRNPRRYFDQRLAWLHQELNKTRDPVRVQELRSRIFQIELWGERVYNTFAFRLAYDFRINGEQTASDAVRALGRVDTKHPWHFTCWFGGWDGDLLVGYCKGTLGIPFVPHAP